MVESMIILFTANREERKSKGVLHLNHFWTETGRRPCTGMLESSIVEISSGILPGDGVLLRSY